MGSFIDLTGRRSGFLVAMKRAKNVGLETMWECVCDCGNSHVVRASRIRANEQMSCGCVKRPRHTKHSMSKSPEYDTWVAMHARCGNKNNKRYKDYGGRGISVIGRWDSFENFLSDMGKRPSDKYSLDRIDNNKGYGPCNCRWALRYQQMRNTRSTKRVDVGVSKLPSGNFRAVISVFNKTVHIGVFDTREMAIDARKRAETILWKE